MPTRTRSREGSGQGIQMDLDHRDIPGTGDAGDGRSRTMRAFGLLRRRETGDPVGGEHPAQGRSELPYTTDPDVARRIAQFVGQQPSDTDLTWLQAE